MSPVRRLSLPAFLLLLLAPGVTRSQEVGPPHGSLVIVGGGLRDPAILERFIQLAGGPQVPIVIIPTAGGGDGYDEFYPGLEGFHRLGAFNLTVLHTHDPQEADTESFVRPITEANGVSLADPKSFHDFARSLRVGDEVRLRVFRDGTTREVVLHLPERPH